MSRSHDDHQHTLDALSSLYPVFQNPQSPVPLAIGIYEVLLSDPRHGLSAQSLKSFLSWYCRRPVYSRTLIVGATRFHADGSAAGEVQPEHSHPERLLRRIQQVQKRRERLRTHVAALRSSLRLQDELASAYRNGTSMDQLATKHAIKPRDVAKLIAKSIQRDQAMRKLHDSLHAEIREWILRPDRSPVMVVSLPPDSRRHEFYQDLTAASDFTTLIAPKDPVSALTGNLLRLDGSALRSDSIAALIDRTIQEHAKLLLVAFVSPYASVRPKGRQAHHVDRLLVGYPPVSYQRVLAAT